MKLKNSIHKISIKKIYEALEGYKDKFPQLKSKAARRRAAVMISAGITSIILGNYKDNLVPRKLIKLYKDKPLAAITTAVIMGVVLVLVLRNMEKEKKK